MPPPRTTPKGYARAHQLRKRLTPAEQKLWTALRDNQLGVSFRRQHAIGPYIADFCCIKQKLIIELDGSQHIEQAGYDQARTAYLSQQGYRVLRFWNHEVTSNPDGVINAILQVLEKDITI